MGDRVDIIVLEAAEVLVVVDTEEVAPVADIRVVDLLEDTRVERDPHLVEVTKEVAQVKDIPRGHDMEVIVLLEGINEERDLLEGTKEVAQVKLPVVHRTEVTDHDQVGDTREIDRVVVTVMVSDSHQVEGTREVVFNRIDSEAEPTLLGEFSI